MRDKYGNGQRKQDKKGKKGDGDVDYKNLNKI